ncbi:YcxB family protein [Streptomyces pharetrae]|jgi:hypothetical protein|uniref:YcxB family protein n=1 Tax=Streptomyces pharetrae TaxID=291370 RepID=UPI0034605511
MIMDMGRGAAPEQQTVELVYEPTVGDITQALRARLRATRSGRMLRWLPGALAVLAALQAALVIAGPGESLGSVPWLLFAALLTAATPWLQARQVHRFAERQGTFRVVVSDTGVSLATDTGTQTISWAGMPRYAETPDVFVLLSSDSKALGVTMLPKRGVQGLDGADRLRAVLDRHLTRV